MQDRKLKITLGGLPQKVHIKTLDEKNPVLLFLHGGPGVANRHNILGAHADLLDTFTIATWDQRGTGGSYFGVTDDTLTIDRVTEDAAELAEWLCKEYKKDKIFIIGGSWGSLLGAKLACRYPDRIAAFVGFGQFVNGARNEEISYNFALDAAKEAGDEKAVADLLELGAPQNGVYKGGYDGMMIQRNIMMKYGGYSRNEAKRSYFDSFVKPMVLSGEYSIADLWGLAKGHVKVLKAMWPEVGGTDLAKECSDFKMPVFILDGRLDMNTPAELVEEYFDGITAPRKELHWFENSAHNPMSDEPEAFKSLLRQLLLEVKESENNV